MHIRPIGRVAKPDRRRRAGAAAEPWKAGDERGVRSD